MHDRAEALSFGRFQLHPLLLLPLLTGGADLALQDIWLRKSCWAVAPC